MHYIRTPVPRVQAEAPGTDSKAEEHKRVFEEAVAEDKPHRERRRPNSARASAVGRWNRQRKIEPGPV